MPRVHYRYLVEGSCGIPFYCEELLKNLDQHRVLIFQQTESEEKANVSWNNLFSESPAVFPALRRAADWAVRRRPPGGQRVWGVRDCVGPEASDCGL